MVPKEEFLMRNNQVISLRAALEDFNLSCKSRQHVRLCFNDGTNIEMDKKDYKTLPQYLGYGVRSHSTTYSADIYEIAEIPERLYEELAIKRDQQKIEIKRIVDRRWGYASDGRIIFEMPDGDYKYIMAGIPSRQLKETDLKPIRNAHLLKEKFKNTLSIDETKIVCKMYGLKISGGKTDEGKEE